MSKYLRVTMPDGSQWDVPAELIAKHRAAYYARLDTGKTEGEKYDQVYRMEFTYVADSELIDWSAGEINWDDVKDQAVKVADPPQPDFQEGWVNGPKKIVEKEASA